jgi:isocitrate/isopropylmalate dehydrogenase
MMPENGRSLIRNHDAILFGSAGHPDIPDHITLWGLRLAICQPFDQYANVRPTRVLPGITSPLRSVKQKELDWVIVRENSEGEYAGVGGRVHQGSPLEAATDVAMFTRAGVERIMRFAFRLALSDLASALADSLGIAPTANLNPERTFPSMFEPIHGSAFDIIGKGVANPVGTFWSAVMMLEHLGEKAAGDRLMKAIERVTADDRFHTPDLGGKAKTSDVTAAVIDAIHGANA